MRIRQIKPSFWSDSHIADLTEPARLFYVGLWMVADDAGWLRWDAREIALVLYGYENAAERAAKVESLLAELVAAGRVIEHPCGHVEVPRLKVHQRLAGPTKQVRTALNEHLKRCLNGATTLDPGPVLPASPQPPASTRGREDVPSSPPVPAGPRTDPQLPGTERLGTERNGTGKRNGTVSARGRDIGPDREPEPGGLKARLGTFDQLVTAGAPGESR